MRILVGTRGFLVLFSLLSILVSPCFCETKYYTWEVEYMHWAPDCIESVVMAINGKFPGPEIRARVGDTLNITVINHLHTEGVVIHWHGILQRDTPWADGTASISQCPINPGETFVYVFKVDKPGTYFYHGHFGMQRAAGLYGPLIVDLPKDQKEPFGHYNGGEHNLLLSDWWHQSVHKQEVDLSAKPFRFIGEPQTLLINGKGQFNCSLIPSKLQCNFESKTANEVLLSKQCGPEILEVKAGKTYRLRVASTTSLSSLNLQIEDHTMMVVEADGNYVEPFEVSDLDIYSGESYSVILTTKKENPGKNFWISIGIRGRDATGKTEHALALLKYTQENVFPAETLPPIAPKWDDYEHSIGFAKKVFATESTEKPPKASTDLQIRQIKLLNTQAKVNDYIKWAINGISLTLPSTPYLGSIKYDLKDYDETSLPDSFPNSVEILSQETYPKPSKSNAFYKIEKDQVIDVILQNAVMLEGNHSEIHPWHLHGHDFWVLGYGEGKFSKGDETKFNLENPPLKNTVSVFPYGWTALRFKADNPGVWAFHCHIEPHLHMGMGIIFVEDVEGIKKLPVPNDAISCGHTAKLLMTRAFHLLQTNVQPPLPSPQPSP